MGHRCYVAYESGSRRFDVRYSHWGGHGLELRNDITKQTPLGGDASKYEPGFIDEMLTELESIADAVDGTVEGHATKIQDDRTVEPEPVARNCTMAEVTEMVDEKFDIEALYVVTDEFDVRAFQPMRVRFLDRGCLLVEPRWWDDEPTSNALDRGWFKGVQTSLQQSVDKGQIRKSEASDRAVERVLERVERNLSKQVLAHSPALTDENHEEHPLAYVQLSGTSKLHNRSDESLPTGYRNIEHWTVPDGFDTVLPEPLDDGERVPLEAKSSAQLDFSPFTSEDSLNGVSGEFDVGDRVHDRTRNRSGPGSSNTLVVVWTPNTTAEEHTIPHLGTTVAEENPKFDRRDSVVEVVYVNELPDHIDADDSTQISECYQRGDLETADVSKYAFPEGRLGKVASDGSTVKQLAD